MSETQNPGYYLDPLGKRRWWDPEHGWGPLHSEEVPSSHSAHAAGVDSFEPVASDTQNAAPTAPAVTRSSADAPQTPGNTQKSKRTLLWVSVVCVLSALFVLTVGVERWQKVVVEAVPETYRTVETPTDVFYVSVNDDRVCWIGQLYQDCINSYIDNWNFACAERHLTESAKRVCDEYDQMIYDMKSQNAGPGSTVAGEGGSGTLSVSEQHRSVRVGNDDEIAEVTRDAYCVLWAFLECEWHEQ